MRDELSRQWHDEGYIVVRALVDGARCARLLAFCENILAQWREKNPETGEAGGGVDATVMRHLNHPGYFSRENVQDKRDILRLVADAKVLDICRAILLEEPLFRCTSLFMNPQEKSLDGNWHRDSQFHCPDEEDEKRFIAAGGDGGGSVQLQIALAPSDDVEVVPASHRRWDTAAEYAIRRADGQTKNRSNNMPGALRVALEPGDAVAFNPRGLHRGRYHADKLRRTLMLTYTKTSAPHFDYFSDQPWFVMPGYLDGLDAETSAFFLRFIEQYKENWQESRP
jgi:ectoine hydroxylase-related dioxygenase (phytanoyl-CoA dioxygenase family)